MSKKNKIILSILVVISLTAMIIGSISYYRKLRSTLDDSILQNMKEMSNHDVTNIQATVNETWNSLEGIGTRMKLHNQKLDHIHNLEDIQVFLDMEKTATIFNRLYLIDSLGNVYSSSVSLTEDQKNKVKEMIEGKDKLVSWYDENVNGKTRESLLYALKIEPFILNIGGTQEIEFVSAVGITNLIDMANTIEVESFGGKGSSIVIDSEGYFIVREKQGDITLEEGYTYFDWLKTGTFYNNMTAEKCIEQIREKEEFSFHYKNADKVSRILTCTPIPDTDWYLIISVPTSVLRQQTNSFLWMTIFILAVVAGAFLFLIFISFKMWSNSHYAKAESKAQSAFLSNMSHEIRTPLHGLIGLNYLMKQSIDNKELMQSYLDKSETTANYLLTLINDILDLSKLQAGKVELEHKPFNLSDSMEGIQIMFQDRMKEKNLDFILDCQYISPNIFGDEMRLKQILINIIGNSLKFTKEGKVVVEVRQETQANKIMNLFTISDTGCGMSKEYLPFLFDPFTQERNDVSNGTAGTGLGMPITYLLIDKMGGKIEVESELNKGTTFRIAIPTDVVEDMEFIQETEIEKVKEKKHYNILVAEDNELNAEIMEEILVLEGFSVSIAKDGKEALEMVEKSKLYEFDAILMDGQMPIMNGYEATKAIRALPREDVKTMKIYACTANTLTDDKKKALDCGMDEVITKPVDVKVLLELLNNPNTKIE